MNKTFTLIITFLICVTASAQRTKNGEVGIDISHHQGRIDWDKVEKDSIVFVYVKATEGRTYVDPEYENNVRGAIKAGIPTGAYHYFRMTSSVEDQFVNFSQMYDKFDHKLIPMVDVETCDGKDIRKFRTALLRFLRMIESHYGVRPMIYATNRSYNELCGTAFDLQYPLYIGRFGESEPVTAGKSKYSIWQYSEDGHLKGIPRPVDFCRFRTGCSIRDIMMP